MKLMRRDFLLSGTLAAAATVSCDGTVAGAEPAAPPTPGVHSRPPERAL